MFGRAASVILPGGKRYLAGLNGYLAGRQELFGQAVTFIQPGGKIYLGGNSSLQAKRKRGGVCGETCLSLLSTHRFNTHSELCRLCKTFHMKIMSEICMELNLSGNAFCTKTRLDKTKRPSLDKTQIGNGLLIGILRAHSHVQ